MSRLHHSFGGSRSRWFVPRSTRPGDMAAAAVVAVAEVRLEMLVARVSEQPQ